MKKITHWAFLVGVSNYNYNSETSKLKSFPLCDRHVEEIAEILAADDDYTEESIITLTSESETGPKSTRNDILIEFDRFLQEKVKSEDTLLFYFVGHGGMYYDSFYIFPKDACISKNKNLLKETSISINTLNSQVEQSQSSNKNVFFIIDACRDREAEGLSGSTNIDISSEELNLKYDPEIISDYPTGTSYLFSCSPNQLSRVLTLDGKKQSLFSYMLTIGLREKISKPVTYGKLVSFVLHQVPRNSTPKQIPHDKSSKLAYKVPLLGSNQLEEKVLPEEGNKLNELSKNLQNLVQAVLDRKKESLASSNELQAKFQQYTRIFEEEFSNKSSILTKDLLYYLGVAYSEHGQHEQAMWAFKTLSILEDSATINFYLGKEYLNLKLSKEAENAFERTLFLDPNHTQSWYELGLLFYEQGEFRKSEEYLKTAISHEPQYIDAWYQLGLLLFDFMRLKEAEKALRKVVNIQPNHTEAWNNLGDLLFYYRKKYNKAEIAFRKAIKLNPKYVQALYNLGNLLSRDRKWLGKIWLKFPLTSRKLYIKAEAYYKKAKVLDPTFIPVHVNLGVLYYKQNLMEQAKQFFLNAINQEKLNRRDGIKFNPDVALAWYNLGILYHTQCEQAKAKENKQHLYEDSKSAYSKASQVIPDKWNLKNKIKKRLEKLEKLSR